MTLTPGSSTRHPAMWPGWTRFSVSRISWRATVVTRTWSFDRGRTYLVVRLGSHVPGRSTGVARTWSFDWGRTYLVVRPGSHVPGRSTGVPHHAEQRSRCFLDSVANGHEEKPASVSSQTNSFGNGRLGFLRIQPLAAWSPARSHAISGGHSRWQAPVPWELPRRWSMR